MVYFAESCPLAKWLNDDPEKHRQQLVETLSTRGVEVTMIINMVDVGILIHAKSFGRVSVVSEILSIGGERFSVYIMYSPDRWPESSNCFFMSSPSALVERLFVTHPITVLRSIKVDGKSLDGVGVSPSASAEGAIDVFGRAEDMARLGDTVSLSVDGSVLEIPIVKFPLSEELALFLITDTSSAEGRRR